MVLRRLAAAAMYTSLLTATALSLAWVVTADTTVLEPAAQVFGLTAAFAGIVAERLATEWQRRRLAITALTEELGKNKEIIDELRHRIGSSGRRQVHPRLLLSAADGVISSGVLATGGNRELMPLLHRWRDEVADVNRRLDLTEMLTFLQSGPEVSTGFEQALARADVRLQGVAGLLAGLLALLDGDDNRVHTEPTPRRPRTAGSRWLVVIKPPARPPATLPDRQQDDRGESQPIAS